MCGIVGAFSAQSLEISAARLEAAVDALAHRGPDDRGVYWSADRRAFLGHRRLSIIDLSGGQQPLVNETGRRRLIYNGEIYNFRALRTALERSGHVFRSHSDGEAALHGFEEDPAGFPEALSGMFALAILDEEAGRLTLARDRLGIKPLFVYHSPKLMVFASELKALVPLLPQRPRICRAALIQYLRWKYVPAPLTFYEDVYELPAGTRLDVALPPIAPAGSAEVRHEPLGPRFAASADAPVDPVLEYRARRYWAIDYAGPRIHDEREAVEELDRRLRAAVHSHLESDVEVGALLSGGVDSSLVVALATQLGARRLKTFAVGFKEPGFDQLPFARRLAEHCGTEHHETLVTFDARSALPRVAQQFDQPFADSSALASDLVCRAAAEHVRVVLTGDGGDEAFAGYQRYQPLLAGVSGGGGAQQAGRTPAAWQHLLHAAGAQLLSPEAKPLQRLRYAAQPALRAFLLREHTATDYLLDKLLPTEVGLGSAWGTSATRSDGAQIPAFLHDLQPDDMADFEGLAVRGGWSRLSAGQYFDVTTYLPGDILTKVDRTSMAYSLECRPPLLDHAVIEFSARLAPDLLIRAGVGKYLLKRVAERYVPRELIYRKKRGFRVPLRRWMKADLLEHARTRLRGGRLVQAGVLSAGGVAWVLRAQRRPWMNLSSLLWALLCLEEWACGDLAARF